MELVGGGRLAPAAAHQQEGKFSFQIRRIPHSERIPMMSGVWHIDSVAHGPPKRALRSSWGFEDTMLSTPRPTPTCTRFHTTVEMPCMKCAEPMRLAMIEPRRRAFDLLTYHCVRCDSDESFLTAR